MLLVEITGIKIEEKLQFPKSIKLTHLRVGTKPYKRLMGDQFSKIIWKFEHSDQLEEEYKITGCMEVEKGDYTFIY